MPLYEEHVELPGPILGGRDRQVREDLVARLAELPPNALMVLDCTQVEFMDYSWADEVVAGLLQASRRQEPPRFLVVREPRPSVSESIAAAVAMHGLTLVQVNSQGSPVVLGGLSPALMQTYQLAVTRGQISAQDLPENLSPSTKSNRLKELERRGLLFRVGEEIIDGGGRRYIYEAVR